MQCCDFFSISNVFAPTYARAGDYQLCTKLHPCQHAAVCGKSMKYRLFDVELALNAHLLSARKG